MKSLTLDKVHHNNEQPHSHNLLTKPKLQCTAFLICNLVCSSTICWCEFDNHLVLSACMSNQCLEHSLFGMSGSNAGQIVDFELVACYFEIPEMRKYGWSGWLWQRACCRRSWVGWGKFNIEPSQVSQARFQDSCKLCNVINVIIKIRRSTKEYIFRKWL